MKTASVQYLDTTVNNRLHVSFQFDTSLLTNVNTYIMKKLTTVSPFLLLLIPVFVMMIFTITGSNIVSQHNEMTMKSAPANAFTKAADYQVK